MVKERPILFNGAMVRAILEGRKTVTRRALNNQMANGWQIVDPKHPMATITSTHPKKGKFGLLIRREIYPDSGKFEHDVIVSPFGRPGDRLWVRETWQGPLVDDNEQRADPHWWKDMSRYQNPAHCAYQASGDSCEFVDPDGDMQCRWKPSIHMPRWASRILLEITDVRVERLQAITYEQAAAEGIHRDHRMWFATDAGGQAFQRPEQAFAQLWRQAGGDWDANPWVWVVEFKRVEAGDV